MSNIPAILHRVYQNALIATCDKPRSAAALDLLIRVRELQKRAAKHYGQAVLKGPRA